MQPEIVRANAPTSRQHGLDLVRAAAITAVMLYHAKNMMLMPNPAPWLVSFGWMGVDLFFVLSGFLIASQLLKPLAIGSKPRYGRFFLRRALRTLPALAVVLALYFAFPQLRESRDIQPFWQFATFTENLLVQAGAQKAFTHFWSLCVEEQFYLLFPILLLPIVSTRPTARKVAGIMLAILLAGVVVRTWLWLPYAGKAEPDAYVSLIYYPTWSRLDGLLAGVAIAVLKIFRPEVWKTFVAQPNLLLALGLSGIASAIMLFGGLGTALLPVALGFPLLAVSVALVVAAASTGLAVVGKYRIPGSTALAAGAYSLYLSHKIAYHATEVWIAPAFGATGYARFGLAVLVALAIGALLYWSVERPFLQLRDRWEGLSRPSIPGLLVEARTQAL